jgi:hypothetical protein
VRIWTRLLAGANYGAIWAVSFKISHRTYTS